MAKKSKGKPRPAAERWVERGIELLDDEPEEALRAIDRGLAADPTVMGGVLAKVLAMRALERPPEDVLAVLDAGIARSPKGAGLLAERGDVLFELARFEEALASHEAALALRPAERVAQDGRIRALAALARHDEAERHAEALLEELRRGRSDDDRLDALELEGALEAIRADRAAGRPPFVEQARWWCERAKQAAEAGRSDEAFARLERAAQLGPADAEPWVLRGVLLDQLLRPAEALAAYDRALELDARDPATWTQRAVALLHAGEPARAVESHERALALDPRWGPAVLGRAEARMVLACPEAARGFVLEGRRLERTPERALERFERALRDAPDSAAAHAGRGGALAALGRHEESLAAYERATELDPDNPRTWSNMVLCLAGLNRPQDALRAIDHGVRLAPMISQAHSTRGAVLFALRRLDEALASFDAALALEADLAPAHHGRARTLLTLGRRAEALTSVTAYLRSAPRDEAERPTIAAMTRLREELLAALPVDAADVAHDDDAHDDDAEVDEEEDEEDDAPA